MPRAVRQNRSTGHQPGHPPGHQPGHPPGHPPGHLRSKTKGPHQRSIPRCGSCLSFLDFSTNSRTGQKAAVLPIFVGGFRRRKRAASSTASRKTSALAVLGPTAATRDGCKGSNCERVAWLRRIVQLGEQMHRASTLLASGRIQPDSQR